MTIENGLTASANPFASRFIDALSYRCDGTSTCELLHRLDTLGGRAAVVGPHGSGKTTLMGDLGDALALGSWTVHRYRTTQNDRPDRGILAGTFGPSDAVLLDGAGHIGPIGWQRLRLRLRGAGRVVITAHAPGRLPTLHHCSPSIALLDALIVELAGDHAGELRPVSRTLFAHHCGNIRDVLRGLYDHCAGLS